MAKQDLLVRMLTINDRNAMLSESQVLNSLTSTALTACRATPTLPVFLST